MHHDGGNFVTVTESHEFEYRLVDYLVPLYLGRLESI